MEIEAALRHFADGLLPVPALHRDAVERDHGPGAVRAVLAMHEHRGAVRVGDDSQEAHHVRALGLPGVEGDVLVADGEGVDFVAVGMEAAQIDDGADAERLEPGYARRLGLRAAIELVADLVQVGQAGPRERLRPVRRARIGGEGRNQG